MPLSVKTRAWSKKPPLCGWLLWPWTYFAAYLALSHLQAWGMEVFDGLILLKPSWHPAFSIMTSEYSVSFEPKQSTVTTRKCGGRTSQHGWQRRTFPMIWPYHPNTHPTVRTGTRGREEARVRPPLQSGWPEGKHGLARPLDHSTALTETTSTLGMPPPRSLSYWHHRHQ